MNQARIFAALWPDPVTREAITAAQRSWSFAAGARVVGAKRLHLTLVFLGSVARHLIPRLMDVRVAIPAGAFELQLNRSTLMGAQTAILEPRESCPPLQELQQRVAGRLLDLGIAQESRPFRPHVTLARNARGSRAPAHLQPIHWPICSWALVESRLGRQPTYEVLRTFGPP